MKPEIKFETRAYLKDFAMWSLCKNISVFLAPNCDCIIFTEESWEDYSTPNMDVMFSLLDKIEELKKETEEFEAEDLDILEKYLLKAEMEAGVSCLSISV